MNCESDLAEVSLIPGLLGAPQYRGGGADSVPPT